MSQLFLSKELQLPLEAVTETFGILATKGAGKTNTGVVLVEELLERGQKVVVADPTGVWWGLRSTAGGDKAGFPIVIFGGDKGDLPLHESDGEMVATTLVEQKFSAILDFSNLRKGQQTRFMTKFAETLYHKQAKDRQPIHFMIDEADSFAPQRPMPGEQQMLGALEDIVRRGRSRGIGCTLISQRSAVLNKNVLNLIEVLIVLRTIAPQDRDTVEDWLKVNVATEERKTVMGSLAELQKGEAWVWSPSWLQVFKKVQIRMRGTFDSSATPKASAVKVKPVTRAEINLDALGAQIAAAREKAKATDPKLLQEEVARLKQQIRKLEQPVAVKPDNTRAFVEAMNNRLDGLQEVSQVIYDASERLNTLARMLRHQCAEYLKKSKVVLKQEPLPMPEHKGVRQLRHLNPKPAAPQEEDGTPIGKGERKILAALAWSHPTTRTRAELGTLAGFSHTGGTFLTYLSRLRNRGYLSENGDAIGISEAGLDFIGDDHPDSPRTPQDIQQMWRSKLGSGEGRMLQALIDIYPESFTREDLAERVNMEASGGTFLTYLSRLRCNGLVEDTGRGGTIKASASLFP